MKDLQLSQGAAPLSIVQLNTHPGGGAGRAALRLHKGLLELGQSSSLMVKEMPSPLEGYQLAPPDDGFNKYFPLDHLINKYYIFLNRTPLSNTYFSFSYPGYDLSKAPQVAAADIIQLHWVDDFLSPVSLAQLYKLDKPIVWTLHDQKAFTGGCHYSAGCTRYEQECRDCPQLNQDPFQLPNAIIQDKLALFRKDRLTIVTPSKWLGDLASRSRVLQGCRIEVIPNALETDIFRPIDKAEAKRSLGIDPAVTTLMFGTCDASEKRKGFQKLVEAMRICLQDPAFADLVSLSRVRVLTVGKVGEELREIGVPLTSAGYVDDDELMATYYAASDLFILPSLEDNLPNTMLEAMACGTPVAAFEIGGMPDLIETGRTGMIAPDLTAEALAGMIMQLVFDPEKRAEMGRNCSELIRSHFKLQDQAKRYLALYQDLLSRPVSGSAPRPGSPYGSHTDKAYTRMLAFSLQAALQQCHGLDGRNYFVQAGVVPMAAVARRLVSLLPHDVIRKFPVLIQ